MPSLVSTGVVIVLTAGLVVWMWTRMRKDRAMSADDYVNSAKERARAEMQPILRQERRRRRRP